MADDGTGASCSRRSLLNGGAALVAGGLLGSATGVASAAAKPGQREELPWRWAKIDPMEAGSRAYRYYFDPGG